MSAPREEDVEALRRFVGTVDDPTDGDPSGALALARLSGERERLRGVAQAARKHLEFAGCNASSLREALRNLDALSAGAEQPNGSEQFLALTPEERLDMIRRDKCGQ